MSAAEFAAVLLGVLALAMAAVTVVVVQRLLAVTRELQRATEALDAEVLPAVDELRQVAGDARADLDRIDRIIEGSEVVADRVDAASKIAYSAVSRPVIKAMAVRAGTAEAVRKMRGR